MRCGSENETGQTLDGAGRSYAGLRVAMWGEGDRAMLRRGLDGARLCWGAENRTEQGEILLWWAGGV